jgi:hypothetical protein
MKTTEQQYQADYYLKNKARLQANKKLRYSKTHKRKTDWLYTQKICCLCKKTAKQLMKHARIQGRQYYSCRKCNTARLKQYRATKIGGLNVRKAVYKSIKKHSEKQNARKKLFYARTHGKVVKPKKCSVCGKIKPLHGHHKDYTKLLDVIWVCRDCHTML